MPIRPTNAEVLTDQDSRAFIQYGAARPQNAVNFYGVSAPYSIISAATIPINGAVSNAWVPSRTVIGKYEIARRLIAPPAIAAATLNVLEKRNTLNKFLAQDCQLTAYLAFGACADLSNFLSGWTDKVEIYAEGIVGSINGGARGSWNSEALITNQIPLSLKRVYSIGQLGFGSVAGSTIAAEIVDVVYGGVARCGNCGAQNDGTQWIYAAEKRIASSGGDQADVVYSTDGGATWTVAIISGIGTAIDPSFIDIVGDKLVVGVNGENAYYYATINQNTGAVGAFTKVTTGFVASHAPEDIFVANSNQIYFVGDGGYIYYSTDIAAGVTVLNAASSTTNDLLRIAGDGNNTLVAVGLTGTVLVSSNNGRSWTVETAPSANNLTAVEVLDSQRFWTGDALGGLYYSLNQALTWNTKALSDSPAQINDIVFLNDEIGWVCGKTATPTGLLWTTWNGGDLFTSNAAAPRMFGVPTTGFQSANRVGVPFAANTETAANNVVVAGLGAGAVGILLSGSANFI